MHLYTQKACMCVKCALDVSICHCNVRLPLLIRSSCLLHPLLQGPSTQFSPHGSSSLGVHWHRPELPQKRWSYSRHSVRQLFCLNKARHKKLKTWLCSPLAANFQLTQVLLHWLEEVPEYLVRQPRSHSRIYEKMLQEGKIWANWFDRLVWIIMQFTSKNIRSTV